MVATLSSVFIPSLSSSASRGRFIENDPLLFKWDLCRGFYYIRNNPFVFYGPDFLLDIKY